MVAIVSGMRAGLDLGSREVLGQSGVIGHAMEGRNGQGVYVNVATGLLTVQNQDDLLVARGQDAAVLRTYDARGNLRDVADARAHVVMDYDRAGNRTRVATFVDYQGVFGEAASFTDRYFQYDAMNRQVVVDAVDTAGNLGTQGHRLTYDRNGNRTSDTFWGNQVVRGGGVEVTSGYYPDGSPIVGTTPVTYTAVPAITREEYGYDALNRLERVVKDGVQIDLRLYDGADRVILSGPNGGLPVGYAQALNQGLAPGQMNGNEIRTNRYNSYGRLVHQEVRRSDGTQKLDISWDPGEAFAAGGGVYYADGYDAAGNVLGYVVRNYENGGVNEYTMGVGRFEGYQVTVTNGASSIQRPGSSTQQYDANGFLVGIVDSTQSNNNRTFVNDASGRALFVNQAGHIQRQLIVNGEVLGLYGAGVNAQSPASGYNNNPNFANVVDFDFGYSPISANYPGPSPGTYTVRTGDTLQSIAQGAYGDSSLWYRIAEANGLATDRDLRVGQTVNIPNRVSTISNNSATFKPYDPSRIEGDKTPSLATPQPKKSGGGLFGQLLMIIVAIVATILTAGAAALAMNAVLGASSTWAAGMAAIGGGTFGAATITAGALGSITASTIASAAIGAAVGSIASQTVGLATGNVDKFDWNGVALSALSGGIAAGLPVNLGMLGDFGQYGNVMVRAAAANAITQGIGVVTGVQRSFDWRGVAGSAVGAGVGAAVGEALGLRANGRPVGVGSAEFFATSLAKGMAAGVAVSAARGGRVAVQQVAVDAFGNALGQGIADAMSSPSMTAGDAWQADMAKRKAENNPFDLPTVSREGPSAHEIFRGSEIRDQNADAVWQQHVASATSSHGGMSEDEYWNRRGLSQANRYAETFGGEGVEAGGRMKLPAGWRMSNGRMIAPDGTDMGTLGGGGMLAINIRDRNDTQLARESFRRTEIMERNAAAAEITAAAQGPLPAGWNMRDASAALAQRDYEARLANAPSMTAWDGVSGTQRLEATARTIDAIGGNPMGAAGYLMGRGLGVKEGDAAVMAIIGSTAGELLALRPGPKLRPTWRQSELDVGAQLEPNAYRAQVSFRNGVEVPYGTKGSVRPDYFGFQGSSSVEVKNYNVETQFGRDRLVNNVSEQAVFRAANLPSGSGQSIYIDVRGQNVPRQQLNDVVDRIVQRSIGVLQHQQIMIIR